MARYCDSEGGCGGEIADDARSDAVFCSNACRQREYRRLKKVLAPWGGDAGAALDYLLSHPPWQSVTDSSPDSRNA
jgi:hypothetical protein